MVITSCQKEHEEFYTLGDQIDSNYVPEVQAKELRLSELEDGGVVNHLHLSSRKSFSTATTTAKKIEGTNFLLHTDRVVLMERSNTKTYTFRLTDLGQPNRLVNLLVSKTKSTGDYKMFLVDYQLSEADILRIQKGKLNQVEAVNSKVTITPFQFGKTSMGTSNGAPCYTEIINVGVQRCSGNEHHLPGASDCIPGDAYYYFYRSIAMVPCDDVSEPVNSGLTEGGSGGGGGGNAPSDNPVDTKPILKIREADPCLDTQELFQDEAFKEKIEELYGKIDESNEWGFTSSSTDGLSAVTEGTENHFEVELTPNSTGYAHSHPDTPMFSPADFLVFRDLVNIMARSEGVEQTDAYGIMLSSGGNYMLRFTKIYGDIFENFKSPALTPEGLVKEYIKTYKNKYDKKPDKNLY